MKTKILVTGGAGYIGSHTVKALGRKGFETICLDNLSMGHRWAVRSGTFLRGDIGDATLLHRIFENNKIAAVLHFAASAYVGESMTSPQKYFRNNVINSLNLLEVMLEHSVKNIVFSSTCATYGVPDNVPLTEEHRQDPVNPYGESKLIVEKALRWFGETMGMQAAVLRYFNAAGADPEGEIGELHNPETHLVPLAIQTALGQRQALEIFGQDYPTKDGTAVRDYVHVSDLAEAHTLALEHLLQGHGDLTLNLGSSHGHSVQEVVDMVQSVSGKRVVVKESGRRAGDPAELIADASKARGILGWKPKYDDLRSVVETAWRWHSSGMYTKAVGG